MHAFRLHTGNRNGDRTRAEHSTLVAALSRGDPDAAAAAMRTHLGTARRRLPDFAD